MITVCDYVTLITYCEFFFQDLICHLLVVDVKKRYCAGDILEHSWIKVFFKQKSVMDIVSRSLIVGN